MSMKRLLAFIVCSGVLGSAVNATPSGHLAFADLTSVNGQPALCLPERAKAPFAVGWVILTERSARNAGVWGLQLKEGATPLMLKPGECFTYGVVPQAYELMKLGANERPLALAMNNTYSFRLHSALQSTDVYTVAFCVGQGRDGMFEFYKRPSSLSREKLGAPCKASKDNNVSE